MKGVLRSFKRMRMSPMERIVDNIRNKEFKEASALAKKEVNKLEDGGKEFAETVSKKLSQLDYSQRKEFFDELAKSPERLKHMVYESDEYNKALKLFENRNLKSDLLALVGGIVLLCGLVRMLRRR